MADIRPRDAGPFGAHAVQLFGIPIQVSASWFLIVAMLTWSLAGGYFPARFPGLRPVLYGLLGAAAALLVFACVLLHELGHSLIARRHGIPVGCIRLFFFGGQAQILRNASRPSVELQMAAAGPLVSVGLVAGCVWGLAEIPPLTPVTAALAALLRYLASVNMALLLFNLLPGFPLDGGRMLRAVLWAWLDSRWMRQRVGGRDEAFRRATRLASLLGILLGFGLMLLGGWVIVREGWLGGGWYLLLGWFLRRAAQASYRAAYVRIPN